MELCKIILCCHDFLENTDREFLRRDRFCHVVYPSATLGITKPTLRVMQRIELEIDAWRVNQILNERSKAANLLYIC